VTIILLLTTKIGLPLSARGGASLFHESLIIHVWNMSCGLMELSNTWCLTACIVMGYFSVGI